jgi:hypothetical protein
MQTCPFAYYLLLLVLVWAPGQAAQIECGDVYASLQQHVRSSQAWPALDSNQACMADAFIIKSLMHMNASTLQESNGVLFLTDDSRALAELLAFSIVGRHFVEQEAKQSFAFAWNRYHRTLTLELLPCEFSRPLYDFVLLCALLTILCVVVLQEQVKVHTAAAQTGSDRQKGNAIVGFASAYPKASA